MDSAQRVGRRIGAIRKRRGLTQAELGNRIGRSVNAMSALECGRNRPALDILLRLASVLDVSAREFFAPAVDGGGCPIHAALYGELLDIARLLPLADLEKAVKIVHIVAGRDVG